MNEPSSQLLDLLSELRLATAGQVRSMLPGVRRLAGELPLFDAVWIDALVQARILTPFQGSELHAGRGPRLRVDRYVLVRPAGSFGWGECFQARHIDSAAGVRLYLLQKTHRSPTTVAAELAQLADRSRRLDAARLLPIQSTGDDGQRLWAATAAFAGTTAAAWMVEHGRFPPRVALHLAQLMAAGLAELERASIVHGDISAGSLLLDGNRAWLAHPGLRGIVRPAEGYAHGDLFPAAYDYLAPERVQSGAPASLASDLYACGLLWWHLLTGRPPLAGGNSLGKLQAAQAARVSDVRRLAPDTPPELARALEWCLERDPARRPGNVQAVVDLLGSPARDGDQALTRVLDRRRRVAHLLGAAAVPPQQRRARLKHASAAALVAILFVAACWPAWRRGDLLPRLRAERPTAAAQRSAPARQTAPTDLAPAVAAPPKADEGATPVAFWTQPAVESLTLPTDRPVDLAQRTFRPGQTICAAAGGRARVLVPARGLLLGVEDLTFERIDFVWPAAANPSAPAHTLLILARHVKFEQCRFLSEPGGRPAAAIAWRGPGRGGRAAGDWSGQLALSNCFVRGFAAAVEAPGAGRAAVAATNTLFIECDALVRCRQPPTAEQACELALDRVTARQCGPVVLIEYDALPGAVGTVTVAAEECAFAPRDGEPLLAFQGETQPDGLLAAVEWQGQGSLVTRDAPFVAWRTRSGAQRPLADEQLSVAGLVRSAVQFAGPALGKPDDSRAVQWQVPLQSTEPPGIGAGLP